MDAAALFSRLEAHAEPIRHLLHGIPREQAIWHPAPDQWSMLEVACHLLDEEREDFRTRLDLLLHQPESPWPPINPEGWVSERGYAQRNLEETLSAFLQEREQSLTWLRGLASPAWDAVHVHPRFGSMAAGEILAAWVAHDLLHLRQLTRLHYEYVKHLAQPYGVGYAGDW